MIEFPKTHEIAVLLQACVQNAQQIFDDLEDATSDLEYLRSIWPEGVESIALDKIFMQFEDLRGEAEGMVRAIKDIAKEGSHDDG